MQTVYTISSLYRNPARAPFVIYADFEPINVPGKEVRATGRKSHKYQNQVPCAARYKIVAHAYIAMKFDYKAAVGPDCQK